MIPLHHFLKPGVSTVETNRDWDFSICRDQFLKTIKIVDCVETKFFYFLVKIFKIKTFQLRLSCVKIFIKTVKIFEIFKICWDFLRFINISQHFWDFLRYLRLKNLDKLRNFDWEMWYNWLTLGQDRDKVSRIAKNFMSWQISQCWSRLLGLEGGDKTKLRYLDCQN